MGECQEESIRKSSRVKRTKAEEKVEIPIFDDDDNEEIVLQLATVWLQQ